MREFTRNPSKYIDSLPVGLKVYNEPVAKVVQLDGVVEGLSDKLEPTATRPIVYSGQHLPIEPKENRCNMPYCLLLATNDAEVYNDGSGDMQTVHLCAAHYSKYLKEKGM